MIYIIKKEELHDGNGKDHAYQFFLSNRMSYVLTPN